MPRTTAAVARQKRKKKIFKAAKGYFGGRKNLYRTAKDAVEKGWEHAYRDRKKKEAQLPPPLDRADQRSDSRARPFVFPIY